MNAGSNSYYSFISQTANRLNPRRLPNNSMRMHSQAPV